MSQLKEKYQKDVVKALKATGKYPSTMDVPRVVKVVVNMSVNALVDRDMLKAVSDDLAKITGQRPTQRKATKSISNFKLREGMPIGARVTLRKERMWDFLDKLMNFALPRVRDFRGIPDRGFDGRGNFTLGIKEHTIFPELEADRVENPKGMNITIVTTAATDKEGKFLLDQLGMPFRK